MKKIPQIVKDAAQDLIKLYGDAFDYLGKYEGADVYSYHFPDGSCVGYPFLYLLKDGKLDEVSGSPALYIVDLLVENINESSIE